MSSTGKKTAKAGSGSALAPQFAAGATGGRGTWPGCGGHGGVRGLGGFSGLAEVGERSRLDRGLGHARGDEPRAELFSALGIIEATWGGQVASGGLKVSRLANRLAFAERRLVFVLELLHGGKGQDLRGVQAGAIADLLADPAGGVVEDRWRGHSPVGVPPAVGLLPHVRDVARRDCLPSSGIEYRLQVRGRELALAVELSL